MTINKYFFHYRGTDFMIYAKDIPDAFIPYKRILARSNILQSDFEKQLLEEPVDHSEFHYLTADGLTKEEILNIVHRHRTFPVKESKKYIPAPKPMKESIKEVVDEVEKNTILAKESGEYIITQVQKRGRGRPRKNPIEDYPIEEFKKSIDSFFE